MATEAEIRVIFENAGVPLSLHGDGSYEDPQARIDRLVASGVSAEQIAASVQGIQQTMTADSSGATPTTQTFQAMQAPGSGETLYGPGHFLDFGNLNPYGIPGEMAPNVQGSLGGAYFGAATVDQWYASLSPEVQAGLTETDLANMRAKWPGVVPADAAFNIAARASQISLQSGNAAFQFPTAGGAGGVLSPTGAVPGGVGGVLSPTGAVPGGVGGVLAGGKLVRVTRGGLPETYAILYPIGGGQNVGFVVDPQQLVGIYGANWQSFTSGTVSGEWWDAHVPAETNDLSSILGQSGSWDAVWQSTMRSAALAAGSKDPTLMGQIMSDPEIGSILAQAVIGRWSDQQVQAAMRSSNAYRTVLYPGIDTFIQMGSINPEADWNQYYDTIRASAAQAGIEVGRGTIGGMLGAGVSEQSFAASMPMYVRATQSAGFFNTFNQWAGQELGQSLDFEQWLDFLEGKAPPQLYDVYEKATLQFSADQVAPGLGQPGLIERVADVTDLSESQARSSFLNAASVVRQLDRALLLNKYGLTDDDLVSLEFGIAPTSGRSLDEISSRAEQAIKEEKLLGAPKGTFATDQFGRRIGLSAPQPI